MAEHNVGKTEAKESCNKITVIKHKQLQNFLPDKLPQYGSTTSEIWIWMQDMNTMWSGQYDKF